MWLGWLLLQPQRLTWGSLTWGPRGRGPCGSQALALSVPWCRLSTEAPTVHWPPHASPGDHPPSCSRDSSCAPGDTVWHLHGLPAFAGGQALCSPDACVSAGTTRQVPTSLGTCTWHLPVMRHSTGDIPETGPLPLGLHCHFLRSCLPGTPLGDGGLCAGPWGPEA